MPYNHWASLSSYIGRSMRPSHESIDILLWAAPHATGRVQSYSYEQAEKVSASLFPRYS